MPIRLSPMTTSGSDLLVPFTSYGMGETVTVLIAALGTDGAVLASDSRETIFSPSGPPTKRDDQPKLFRAGDYAIGASGAGAWVGGRVPGCDEGATSTYDVVLALSARMQALANFPPASVLCVRAGEPIAVMQGFGKRGESVTWEAPAVLPDRWRCIGIPEIANLIMGALWSPVLTARQVAVVCALAIRASKQHPFIGGPTQIQVLDGAPWADSDVAQTEAAATRWLSHAQNFTWR